MNPLIQAKQVLSKQVILKLFFILLVLLAVLAIFLFALSGVPIALLLLIPLMIIGSSVATTLPSKVREAIGYVDILVVTLLVAIAIFSLFCLVT